MYSTCEHTALQNVPDCLNISLVYTVAADHVGVSQRKAGNQIICYIVKKKNLGKKIKYDLKDTVSEPDSSKWESSHIPTLWSQV